jgi:formamidopyrimidine-DNA glycosylase
VPELPEVETVKNTLVVKVKGRRITGVEVYLPRLIKFPAPTEFMTRVVNKEILDITRRGKYLLFHLADNYYLVIHLRMTGRLLYLPATARLEKHTHIVFQLDNQYQLRFHDQRTFGTLYLVQPEEFGRIKGLVKLGPEPLAGQFTPQYLQKTLAGRRTSIKSALLNQEIVAGLGNIYVDEALFNACLHPARQASSLTAAEIERLHRGIREVLQAGIKYRGTTIRNYVDGEGQAGDFQAKLAVYGQQGEPCKKCGTPLEKLRISGRSSVYCPRCQPAQVK